jgi:hypothetical protein
MYPLHIATTKDATKASKESDSFIEKQPEVVGATFLGTGAATGVETGVATSAVTVVVGAVTVAVGGSSLNALTAVHVLLSYPTHVSPLMLANGHAKVESVVP